MAHYLLKKRIMLQMQEKEHKKSKLAYLSSLNDTETSDKSTQCVSTHQGRDITKLHVPGLRQHQTGKVAEAVYLVAAGSSENKTDHNTALIPTSHWSNHTQKIGYEVCAFGKTAQHIIRTDVGSVLTGSGGVDNSQLGDKLGHEPSSVTAGSAGVPPLCQRSGPEYPQKRPHSGLKSGTGNISGQSRDAAGYLVPPGGSICSSDVHLSNPHDPDCHVSSTRNTGDPVDTETQERARLIAKILDILRSSVDNPTLGLEGMNKQELVQCVQMLSNKCDPTHEEHQQSHTHRVGTGMLKVNCVRSAGESVTSQSGHLYQTASEHRDHYTGPHLSDWKPPPSSHTMPGYVCSEDGGSGRSGPNLQPPPTWQHGVYPTKRYSFSEDTSLNCADQHHYWNETTHKNLRKIAGGIPVHKTDPSAIKTNSMDKDMSSTHHHSSRSSSHCHQAIGVPYDATASSHPHSAEKCTKSVQHSIQPHTPNVESELFDNKSYQASFKAVTASKPEATRSVRGFLNFQSVILPKHQMLPTSGETSNQCPPLTCSTGHSTQGTPGTSPTSKPALNREPADQSTVTSSGCGLIAKVTNRRNSIQGYQSNPITSSGRNKGHGKLNDPKFTCEVCGDVAAGFHCGAYICEACKKFYLRCLKNDSNLLTCPKSQECVINKDNRSHCQYCRYHKCLKLGMYRPGREIDKKLKVDFKSIPCKVCCAPSSGFHFGAITCEGCKGFFRRMLKENLHQKFTCSSNRSCEITSTNRTFCKCCRFNKCLQVGMTLEGTRLGRQSNSMKRTTLMAYQLGNSCDDTAATMVTAAPQIKRETEDDSYDRAMSTYCKSPLNQAIKDDIEIIEDFDDVSLEILEHLDFDPNFMELEGSPKRKNITTTGKKPNKRIKPGGQSETVGHCLGTGKGVDDEGCLTSEADQNSRHSDPQTSDLTREKNMKHFEKVHSSKPSADLSACVSSHTVTLSECGTTTPSGPATSNITQDMYQTDMLQSSDGHSAHVQGTVNSPQADLTPSPSVLSNSHPYQFDPAAKNHSTGCDIREQTAQSPIPLPPTKTNKVPSTDIYKDPQRTIQYITKIYKLLDGLADKPQNQMEYTLNMNDFQNVWTFCMLSFVRDACLILKYLKAIPGFRELSQAKQVSLTQETMYPICLMFHGQRRDHLTKKTPFFSLTEYERDLFFETFPIFRALGHHFQQSGDWICELEVDDVEIALLNVIFILTTASDRCETANPVYGKVEDLALIFMDYCNVKDSLRGGILLTKMAEVRRCNIEHQEMAFLMKQENQHIDYGPLWTEVFVQK